jgi:hypothetical protein
VKIETEQEYKLMAKLAYNLSFNAPFNGVEFADEDINTLTDAIDAYDVEHGYVMNNHLEVKIDPKVIEDAIKQHPELLLNKDRLSSSFHLIFNAKALQHAYDCGYKACHKKKLSRRGLTNEKTVTYKGNTFIYTIHDCREEGNGEKGYIAFVDLFKGCVTSTPSNNFRQLEKQVRSAIKDWLEPTSLNVAERQRLESLERLVRSKDYFYKSMAENVSEEWIEKGFESWYTKRCNCGNVCLCTPPTPYESMRSGFKAGIQYALKAPTEGE